MKYGELSAVRRDALRAVSVLSHPTGSNVRDMVWGSSGDGHAAYGALQHLEQKGLVESNQCMTDARKNVYCLTDDGREAMAERCAWERGGREVEA